MHDRSSFLSSTVDRSHFISAGGLRTHYLAAGDEGRPVVLVHGGGAGADCRGNWFGMLERLAEAHRVFAIDMVGFGLSEKPDGDHYEYSQDNRERHLASFIKELGVGPVTLVGNSMGGLTSLGVARDFPELVESLVLMGSAGIPVPASDALKTIIDYDFSEEGMAAIVQALTSPGFIAPPGMVGFRHELSVEPETRRAYEHITAWMKERGGLHVEEAAISAVEVPTLVVGGKDDRVVPIACAYRFLELITHAHGYIIPSCGHWPMIEKPELFAALVTHFLAYGEQP
jgi:2-hydroxy-6-oxo-6-(2'-aminophenyl)hexa-2,4-dienoate hydrolase